jgi:hypothetical protein
VWYLYLSFLRFNPCKIRISMDDSVLAVASDFGQCFQALTILGPLVFAKLQYILQQLSTDKAQVKRAAAPILNTLLSQAVVQIRMTRLADVEDIGRMLHAKPLVMQMVQMLSWSELAILALLTGHCFDKVFDRKPFARHIILM